MQWRPQVVVLLLRHAHSCWITTVAMIGVTLNVGTGDNGAVDSALEREASMVVRGRAANF